MKGDGMEKEGICSCCVNDKECTYSRKFPVLQCKEFTGHPPRQTKVKKLKQEKMKFDEEPTVN